MGFDPKQHMIKLQGNREYLPVAWRLVWFREEHSDWTIDQTILAHDVGQWAVCEAAILDETGRLLAKAQKMETQKGFGDYLEKAGTGSIGRALALLGYGTQFADFDEGEERIVDSPQEATGVHQSADANELTCSDCKAAINSAVSIFSKHTYGRALCQACQNRAKVAK